MNALKARLRSGFNVSVAEVDAEDKWQSAVVAVVHVGRTRSVVDSVLSGILCAVEKFNHLQILNYETELIT